MSRKLISGHVMFSKSRYLSHISISESASIYTFIRYIASIISLSIPHLSVSASSVPRLSVSVSIYTWIYLFIYLFIYLYLDLSIPHLSVSVSVSSILNPSRRATPLTKENRRRRPHLEATINGVNPFLPVLFYNGFFG